MNQRIGCLARRSAAAAARIVKACLAATAIVAAGTATPVTAWGEQPLDLVLREGRVVDGTGAPWYIADVGIRDGRIVRIGRIDPSDATEVIDASGLVVAPGFIDMMGQTASPMMRDPETAINLLTQGITTINAGEGGSAAPLSGAAAEREGWTTMAEYFALLEMAGLPVNVVQTVGHTQVRRIVLGDVDRRPSEAELRQMCDLVREAMQAGAIGVSTALIYPPAVFAQTEEIAALAQTAAEHGGGYYTHMRNEGDQLLEAIDEALQIGRRSNAPVHIFHLKTAGRQNWGKMPQAIAAIAAARAAGQQVTADVYPYVHNGLGIAALVHPRHFADGDAALRKRLDDPELRDQIRHEMETGEGWENWYRHVGHDWDRIILGQSDDRRYAESAGQSIAAVARSHQRDPWDLFFDLVRSGAFVMPHSMSEANKILAMQQPFVSFCTDVGPAGGGRGASHPRSYGTFPRLLSRYVRDLGAISLERAVAQASAAAANAVLAYDRGRIAEGLAADIIVFDLDELADEATLEDPHAVSEGMRYVIVNGRLVLKDGRFTGALPGRVLLGPGYRSEWAPSAVATGRRDPRLASFDRMMQQFLARHGVPGAALAVTDHGRLVLARGYGYADLASGEQVQPTSLFRIASISKPITAAAVMRLVQDGRLRLNDPVLDVLDGHQAIEASGDVRDPRLRDVTILHLLQHRGGWDRDQSFDAMFQSVRFAEQLRLPPPADAHAVIRAMMQQPLDFDPGQRYAYSNFGYCLLGRVIEQVTGQTYEAFVRESVLAPLGIQAMRIGATRLAGRAAGEVRYYHPRPGTSVFQADLGQQVPSPYGAWYLEAMDAHGGWLASAVDLARFATALDDPDSCAILSPDSVRCLDDRPPGDAGFDDQGKPKDVYYALGWSNRIVGPGKQNRWHSGSLPGTATILIRRHDGRNFVALLNSRVSPHAEHLGREIDRLLHEAADAVKQWPQEDRFAEFFPAP